MTKISLRHVQEILSLQLQKLCMDTTGKKPSAISGLGGMKCPNCHKGRVFVNKSVFPLGKCLAMVDNCSECGYKMKHESNNGGGINYALTVSVLFLNLVWYWPIFGLSYKDNSFISFLFTSVGVVIILQPWLMRYSRIIYLYLFASFGGGKN